MSPIDSPPHLIVPIHLEAWVVGDQNSQSLARYVADYRRLKQLKSPMPPPFSVVDETPTSGVHLHWALPDALTHGVDRKGRDISFPRVPNRWFVVRFNTCETTSTWQTQAWVVESDYLVTQPKAIGTTRGELASGCLTTIPLALPGVLMDPNLPQRLSPGATIRLWAQGGELVSGDFTVAQPVQKGDPRITVVPASLTGTYPAGTSVQLVGASRFLDPKAASEMDPLRQSPFLIHEASIGRVHTIKAWETLPISTCKEPRFLQAVGPGNVTFAASAPQVQNVFAFTDHTLPPESEPAQKYAYRVVGWYSHAEDDPLYGATASDFASLLDGLQWSISSKTPAEVPSTSLYDGMVVGVDWPSNATDPPGDIDPDAVRIAVGNTAVEGVAGLIGAHASNGDADDASAENPAAQTLEELLVATQFELLDRYDTPGGSALIEQAVHQAEFGSDPGDIRWEIVAVDASAHAPPARPTLTPAQSEFLQTRLTELNKAQGEFDRARSNLASVRENLYRLWWKLGKAGTYKSNAEPKTTPTWSTFKTQLESQYDAQLQLAWRSICTTRAHISKQPLPPSVPILFTATKDVTAPVAAFPVRSPSTYALAPKGAAVLLSGANGTAVQLGVLAEDLVCDGAHLLLLQTLIPSDHLPKAGAEIRIDYSPTDWADATWKIPAATSGKRGPKLWELGLRLKPTAAERFWHPNDPVVVIEGLRRSRKHGEDGRHCPEGKLRCRLSTETITGLEIPGQATIDAKELGAAGVDLDPFGEYTRIPSIANLMLESFLCDPQNAGLIADTVKGNASAIATAMTALVTGNETKASWVGSPSVPFGLVLWKQPWSPLFLEWSVEFYPTEAGTGSERAFSLESWQFDGRRYRWKGSGPCTENPVCLSGRTFVTPHAAVDFQARVQTIRGRRPDLDTPEVEKLIETIGGWDLVSQSLSGLSQQLVTLSNEETFPPPPGDRKVSCPAEGNPPAVGVLVGDHYHSVPIVDGERYLPIRGGFLKFSKLRVIDTFGQTFDLQGRPTIPVGELVPTSSTTPLPAGLVQLPPRLVQSSRLDFSFLSRAGSTARNSDDPSVLCGWLLPNHLDGGIAVYDHDGQLLGELVSGLGSTSWEPRPGGTDTETGIDNPALSGVVESLKTQAQQKNIADVLRLIDHTLWLVDPLGGRRDTSLSVLIGRPLAVVVAQLRLQLYGLPAFSQRWNDMYDPSNPKVIRQNRGSIDSVGFPVRLGSTQLRDDGLIGYFLSDYSKLYSVHTPEKEHRAGGYIQPVVDGDEYQGDLHLSFRSEESVQVTLIVDPRGSVHASTGILPTTKIALSDHVVSRFLKDLEVTFRSGPILADSETLRMPRPAENHGTWSWVGLSDDNWTETPIVNANDRARLPHAPPRLNQGWLRWKIDGSSEQNQPMWSARDES